MSCSVIFTRPSSMRRAPLYRKRSTNAPVQEVGFVLKLRHEHRTEGGAEATDARRDSATSSRVC